MTSLSRRRFFLGLLAAPAIVHIGNLMPVKAAPLIVRTWLPTGSWHDAPPILPGKVTFISSAGGHWPLFEVKPGRLPPKMALRES